MSHLLFAYGTLAPGVSAAAETFGWKKDAIRGLLFDLGPFPAILDLHEPTRGWVDGFVRITTLNELAGDLDTYEGVEEGLFARQRVRTRSGRDVWVYAFATARPEYARGPFEHWNGPRRPQGPRRASSHFARSLDSIEETSHG